MKYSEFIREVEAIGLNIGIYGGYIDVLDEHDEPLLNVGTEYDFSICTDYSSFDKLDKEIKKKLLYLAVELASAPLEDREDEKKYYVKFMERVYLVYYPKSKNYGVVSKREGSGGETQFTEQQIKNLDYRYWEFAEEVKEDE